MKTPDRKCRPSVHNSVSPGTPERLPRPSVALDLRTETCAMEEDFQLGEVVLACIQAEGVDLSSVPACMSTIVFKAEALPLTAQLGREKQPGFFERFVPQHELHSQLSRSHFDLQVHPGAEDALALILRSPSPGIVLHADRQRVEQGVHPVALAHDSIIAFFRRSGGDPFLTLRVVLRSKAEVKACGPHLARPSFMAGEAFPCPHCQLPAVPQPVSQGSPSYACLPCVGSSGQEAAKNVAADQLKIRRRYTIAPGSLGQPSSEIDSEKGIVRRQRFSVVAAASCFGA